MAREGGAVAGVSNRFVRQQGLTAATITERAGQEGRAMPRRSSSHGCRGRGLGSGSLPALVRARRQERRPYPSFPPKTRRQISATCP